MNQQVYKRCGYCGLLITYSIDNEEPLNPYLTNLGYYENKTSETAYHRTCFEEKNPDYFFTKEEIKEAERQAYYANTDAEDFPDY